MKKITSWLAVLIVLSFLIPTTALIAIGPEETVVNEPIMGPIVNDENDNAELLAENAGTEPYYPDFPELPAPPAPGSPYYKVASPPPSYVNEQNRASRIKMNTTTVISIDSPRNLDFVTLSQSFTISGGVYEDNNSNGKNDTGDLPVPNAMLHVAWAHQPGYTDEMTDVNGRFSITVQNNLPFLSPVAQPLRIEFWGQWTINGSSYFEIPRYNISTNIPGEDDDGDNPEKSIDGIDNDGDWRGWDGSSWNDDLNHNGQPDFNYDGTVGNDDDGDGKIDEEQYNKTGPNNDDDGDGLVDEDTSSGDANEDQDSSYDPEPHVDEGDEGIDEEGVPDGIDNDGDTLIDEDCLLEFIPRQNTTETIDLIIQHRTDITLQISPKNAQIGDLVSLSGQLKDPDTSSPVQNKWIFLKFHDNKIAELQVDGEGKFSANYVIPGTSGGDKIDVGRRQFTAVFDQNFKPDNITYYKSSSKSVDITIKRPSQIQITNVDKSVYLQGLVTITGKVTDETGDPLLFTVNHDDGTKSTVQTSDYKVTLMWGKSAASWAPPPKPGFLGPEGNFTIVMNLDNPLQPLGKVDVTVTFVDLTDKYYLPSQTFDEFTVHAHSTIIDWKDVKGFHRGETAEIRAKLVMQDGGISKALVDAQVEARWGPGGAFEDTSPTRFDGEFTFVHEVEAAHQLGPIVVYTKFNSTDYLQGYIDGFDQTESFAHRTFYVIAQPILTLKGGNIIKGQDYTFTGRLTDDVGNPMVNQYVEIYFSSKVIVNKETGEFEPLDPPIAFIPTDSTGKFEYEHTVPETFEVGKAYGAARFKGFQPPYNASNAFDEATTKNVEFNISAETSIVIDTENVDDDLFRDRDFVITGKVYELYKGVLTPNKVKPLRGESLKVELFIQATDVPGASARSIGSGPIGSIGQFQVRARVPADIEISEYVEITMVFAGNARYQESTNTSEHRLWGRIFFDRAEIFSSFPYTDQGRPAVKEWEFNQRDEDYKGPLIITVPVFEEIQGRSPPPVANGTIIMNISGDYFVNMSVGMTNANGIATFQFINPLADKDYPDRIKLLYRDKPKYILEVTVTFVGTTGLQAASTSFNITYYPTEPPGEETFWKKYQSWVIGLISFAIVGIVIMILVSAWYIKQQRLRGLKRIIKRAADQLIAGDQYRATIYKSYKKLSTHLRRYGYLRREAETFREFESAIKQALPIDRVSMHRFLDLLEEARYSTHKIGESQRQAAISNLRAIEGSLSQIIIDEEAAMRALRKLEEEEKEMAAAETEIVVQPGVAEGGTISSGGPAGAPAPPQMPSAGSPPKLPPK